MGKSGCGAYGVGGDGYVRNSNVDPKHVARMLRSVKPDVVFLHGKRKPLRFLRL